MPQFAGKEGTPESHKLLSLLADDQVREQLGLDLCESTHLQIPMHLQELLLTIALRYSKILPFLRMISMMVCHSRRVHCCSLIGFPDQAEFELDFMFRGRPDTKLFSRQFGSYPSVIRANGNRKLLNQIGNYLPLVYAIS